MNNDSDLQPDIWLLDLQPNGFYAPLGFSNWTLVNGTLKTVSISTASNNYLYKTSILSG